MSVARIVTFVFLGIQGEKNIYGSDDIVVNGIAAGYDRSADDDSNSGEYGDDDGSFRVMVLVVGQGMVLMQLY